MSRIDLPAQLGSVANRRENGYDLSGNGNLLTERHWDSTKVASISTCTTLCTTLDASNSVATTYTYSAHGNRLSETDPSNKVTTYAYGAFTGCVGCSDLYPTSETHGASSQLTTSYDYHFLTGLRTSVVDPNSVTATTGYDHFGRPIQVQQSAGLTQLRKTQVFYDDTQLWVYAKSDLNANGDGLLTTIRYFDQIGRPKQNWQLELPQGTTTNTATAPPSDGNQGIKIDYAYAFSTGVNAGMASNPYRPLEGTSAPTRGWTVTYRDTAGRACAVETIAGAALPSPATNCGTNGG